MSQSQYGITLLLLILGVAIATVILQCGWPRERCIIGLTVILEKEERLKNTWLSRKYSIILALISNQLYLWINYQLFNSY